MKDKFLQIDGGITTPRGFRSAGIAAGIKKGRKDMALIVSDVPANVAGLFTTNSVQAAPVRLCRERLAGHKAGAIIINSGNANACTGNKGRRDAETMARLTAEELHIDERTVFVCSTGTIGIPLPMEKIRKGIRLAAGQISVNGGASAARAIMTTDTRSKQIALRLEIDRQPVTIAGMCKGAGMINPNLATLLVFFTTDAAIGAVPLQAALNAAMETSFNRISVDGDRSTNDTVLCLANGLAGNRPLNTRHPAWENFCAALDEAARQLSLMIVRDGEGATKLVAIHVRGASDKRSAEKAARSVAHSLLVKTSWFGADPNWGRVICAVGYSGAKVKEELVDISYDGVRVVKRGMAAGFSVQKLHEIIARKEFAIEIDLHLGQASYTVITCDCSDKYVEINAAYMT